MKLIILDRDGVINYDSLHYIKSPDEWLAIPGSLEAIGQLKKMGFTIALATNQSGINRGLYSEETLKKIHEKMQAALREYDACIDYIVYCPHHPKEKCHCRKPKTGMLEQIQKHFNCSLECCYFVGDSLKDLVAAEKVGATPILVKTGNGLKTLQELSKDSDIAVFNNLLDFVKHLEYSVRDLPVSEDGKL